MRWDAPFPSFRRGCQGGGGRGPATLRHATSYLVGPWSFRRSRSTGAHAEEDEATLADGDARPRLAVRERREPTSYPAAPPTSRSNASLFIPSALVLAPALVPFRIGVGKFPSPGIPFTLRALDAPVSYKRAQPRWGRNVNWDFSYPILLNAGKGLTIPASSPGASPGN